MTEATNKILVTIDSSNIEIDVALFNAYQQEAFLHLRTLEGAKEQLKEVVETMAETTGLPKTLLSKYLKAKYAEKTKELSEVGKCFEALDEGTAG